MNDEDSVYKVFPRVDLMCLFCGYQNHFLFYFLYEFMHFNTSEIVCHFNLIWSKFGLILIVYALAILSLSFVSFWKDAVWMKHTEPISFF